MIRSSWHGVSQRNKSREKRKGNGYETVEDVTYCSGRTGQPGVSGCGTVWLDEVVSFDQPAGSNTTAGINDPTAALGASDALYVSIDIPRR